MSAEELLRKMKEADWRWLREPFIKALNNIVPPPLSRNAEKLSFFSIVRYVLDLSLEQYLRTHPYATLRSAVDGIAERQEYIRTRFRDEYSPPSLNYHDPLLRMAYMLSYSAAHAATIETVLQELKFKPDTPGNTFRVCSYGGGPGTELLSIIRFLYKYSQSSSHSLRGLIVDFTTFDSERDWLNSWKHLRNGLLQSLPPYFKGIAGDFAPLDLYRHAEIEHYEDVIHRANLHIFSYVFSEVRFRSGDFRATFERILDIAQPGAVVLIVDINYPTPNQYIEETINALPSKLGFGWTETQDQKGNMGEPREILQHWNDFGRYYAGTSPQLNWNALFLEGRKLRR